MSQEIAWNQLHQNEVSWRKQLIGGISDYYVIPKYVRLFNSFFGKLNNLDILEIGAGNGDISRAVLNSRRKDIKSYIATENQASLRQYFNFPGVEFKLMNAQKLEFPDTSFDIACAFDVMHHVDNPHKMTQEMTRVSRKYVYLVESNGLSLGRKISEKRPLHKCAGERSYLPRQYKSFFNQDEFRSFYIRPFLFALKTPEFLFKPLAIFNEVLERLPVLRWQCSSLVIIGEKKS